MRVDLRWVPLVLATVFSATASALERSANGVTVTTLLQTTRSWDGKPIVYPSGPAQVTGLLVEIAPGRATGWHTHPVPSFAMILQGTLEVALKNGKIKRLTAGEALAEVVDTLHNGRVVGNQPVKLVVFYTGAVGTKLTVVETTAGDPAQPRRRNGK